MIQTDLEASKRWFIWVDLKTLIALYIFNWSLFFYCTADNCSWQERKVIFHTVALLLLLKLWRTSVSTLSLWHFSHKFCRTNSWSWRDILNITQMKLLLCSLAATVPHSLTITGNWTQWFSTQNNSNANEQAKAETFGEHDFMMQGDTDLHRLFLENVFVMEASPNSALSSLQPAAVLWHRRTAHRWHSSACSK